MSAEIGTQLHHGNRWLGTYDPFGAFINGPDPENTALNSQFIADESDDDPGVLIPASYGPLPDAVDWFEDVDGVTTGAACNDYGPDPPLTDTLIKLVRNPVEFSDYEDEMNWMRKADMLSFLHLNPDYLANPVLDSFFDAESSTALGELIFGHFQLNKIHGADPVMPEKDSLVFEYMAQVRVLDSLIALNPINISTLKALRVLKIDTLSGHFSDWLGMLESQVADTESEISDAVDLVSNASPTNDQETFLQAILLLKGRRSLGDSITTAELTDVYAHARQCPWLGARSLSEAQGLYSLVADSIFTHRPGACSQLESFLLEDRSDKSDRFYEVMIYPNPTTEVIHLKLPTWVQLIEIFNLDGRQWKQLDTPNGGKFTISVYDLPAGMYTIRAQGEKKIETHQLFITQ